VLHTVARSSPQAQLSGSRHSCKEREREINLVVSAYEAIDIIFQEFNRELTMSPLARLFSPPTQRHDRYNKRLFFISIICFIFCLCVALGQKPSPQVSSACCWGFKQHVSTTYIRPQDGTDRHAIFTQQSLLFSQLFKAQERRHGEAAQAAERCGVLAFKKRAFLTGL